MPKVSVNIPCFNSAGFIRETIESVLNQTFRDFEVVVIDDGSKDETGEIIKNYNDEQIHYFYQENQGLSRARNRALFLSRGEYIAFLDHDDIWLPDKLAKQVEILNEQPDIDFVYTNYYKKMSNSTKLFIGYREKQPVGNVFGPFIRYYPVVMTTSMVRKETIDRLGSPFDESLYLTEEYDLFMRLFFKSKAEYIDTPLAIYRVHSGMSSVRFINKYPVEHEYVIEKLKKIEPQLEAKYEEELSYLRAKIGFWYARAHMACGETEKARRYLTPYKGVNYKFFAFYLSTYFPSFVWRMIDYLGNKASIRFD